MTRGAFWLALLLATLLAAWLRLFGLDERPMHTDEAIHAVRCETLWATGGFDYDPRDYHGPTLYYFTLPLRAMWASAGFAQTSETMYRLAPALFGVLMIPLLPLLRGGIGRVGLTAAALLLAVSPAMVFYSRYYIQEVLLAFFTLAAIGCGWRLVVSPQLGWSIALGVAVGLMHATKETCVLSFAAATLAVAGAFALSAAHGDQSVEAKGAGSPRGDWARQRGVRLGAMALGVAALVSITSYSVLFRYWRGPLDSILTYASYLERSGGAGLHDHPWHWYLATLLYTHHHAAPRFSEAMILVLGLVGVVVAGLGRRRELNRAEQGLRASADRDAPASEAAPALRLFLAFYAIVLTAIYCAIPYKTPWCAVQFLLPMILLAGVAVEALMARFRPLPARIIVAVLVLLGVLNLEGQSVLATTRFAADNRNPYVYAHPVRDVVNLGRYVQRLTDAGPDGTATRVNVIMDDAWPLPWYLRGLSRVGYWESITETERDLAAHGGIGSPIVITTTEFEPELDARLDQRRHKSYYGLRPDVMCVVYVDESLRKAFVESQRPSSPVGESP